MPSRATERDALTRTASPGSTSFRAAVERCVGVRRPRRESVGAGNIADSDHLDLELGRQLGDLPVVPVGVLAELRHPAQYRDAAATGAALCRGARSAASVEVGLALYASLTTKPPPGSGSSSRATATARTVAALSGSALERQPQRLVRRHRSERILRLVT